MSKVARTRIKTVVTIATTSFLFLGFFLVEVTGQVTPPRPLVAPLLPPAETIVNCEDILAYLDDALLKAHDEKSNLIVILKAEQPLNLRSAQARLLNLRRYVKYRGFDNFEVAGDFESRAAGSIELHVSGRRLYSLPIGKRDKLDLTRCVVGPKL